MDYLDWEILLDIKSAFWVICQRAIGCLVYGNGWSPRWCSIWTLCSWDRGCTWHDLTLWPRSYPGFLLRCRFDLSYGCLDHWFQVSLAISVFHHRHCCTKNVPLSSWEGQTGPYLCWNYSKPASVSTHPCKPCFACCYWQPDSASTHLAFSPSTLSLFSVAPKESEYWSCPEYSIVCCGAPAIVAFCEDPTEVVGEILRHQLDR